MNTNLQPRSGRRSPAQRQTSKFLLHSLKPKRRWISGLAAAVAGAWLAITPPATAQAPPYGFTNFVGLPGTRGAQDGTGNEARFESPAGVAFDPEGNLYVADAANNTIRRVTRAGVVTTFAGSAGVVGISDGDGADARFNSPSGVAVDSDGNIYVADTSNHTIRKLTPAGTVTTLAGSPGGMGSTDGVGGAARFNNPLGVAVDPAGNVYVADEGNHAVRKITPAGDVSTLVSGGAGLMGPAGIAVDGATNLYVVETGSHTIRKITPAGGVTILAGSPANEGSADGSGSDARFRWPWGITCDRAANLYVADYGNATIRRITPDGTVVTIAGTARQTGTADGIGSAARFFSPNYLALDLAGVVYVTDRFNYRISRGTPLTGNLAVVALSGNLAFGNVPVGSTRQGTLSLANPGYSTLHVQGIAYPAGFSGDWSGNLPPGAATNLTVTFAPAQIALYDGVLTVNCDAIAGENSRSLSGAGTAGECHFLLGPAATEFPASGGTGSFTVTVTNGCLWAATSSAAWLHTTNQGAGQGAGSSLVSYTVDANPGGTTRSATITVGGEVMGIVQASDPTYRPWCGTLWDSGTGWYWNGPLGWLWFDGDWAWSSKLQGWLWRDPSRSATDRTLWSPQFRWLTLGANFDGTAETSTLHSIWICDQGWATSARFDWICAAGDGVWFWSITHGWLGVTDQGGIWSVSQGDFLPGW
jgi:sugar lactone lactonase YvrE